MDNNDDYYYYTHISLPTDDDLVDHAHRWQTTWLSLCRIDFFLRSDDDWTKPDQALSRIEDVVLFATRVVDTLSSRKLKRTDGMGGETKGNGRTVFEPNHFFVEPN